MSEDNQQYILDESHLEGANIKVIGVGGGGGNAINNMISRNLAGVEFIVANTDKQALDHNYAPIKVQLGHNTTRGLGAGANPEIGKKSVEESIDDLKDYLKGSDMIFVTAGMGGGTGTGAAPIIAKVGQEINALVVGIVTSPFKWEGRKREIIAEKGINELRNYVDALIVIQNQKLLEIIEKNTSFREAFQKVDEVLYNATRGISDIIGNHGTVNVDFADVRTIMRGMGDALMGIGTASGDNRAADATKNALNSPMLDGISIKGSQGVLVNITGGPNMTMMEIADAVSIVEQEAGDEATIIHGICELPEETDEISVTVVATGFKQKDKDEAIDSKQQSSSGKQQPLVFEGEKKNEAPPIPSGGFKPPLAFHKTKAEGTEASTTNINSSVSPKGLSELRKFEEPAFMRRHPEFSDSEYKDNGTYGKSNPSFINKLMQ